jgi:hypothetical protein
MDSNHDENLISSLLLVVLIGGTVVGHAKYPLSTKSQAPWYLRVVTTVELVVLPVEAVAALSSPRSTSVFVFSYKSKYMSFIITPSFKSVMKLSNNANVLSFH